MAAKEKLKEKKNDPSQEPVETSGSGPFIGAFEPSSPKPAARPTSLLAGASAKTLDLLGMVPKQKQTVPPVSTSSSSSVSPASSAPSSPAPYSSTPTPELRDDYRPPAFNPYAQQDELAEEEPEIDTNEVFVGQQSLPLKPSQPPQGGIPYYYEIPTPSTLPPSQPAFNPFAASSSASSSIPIGRTTSNPTPGKAPQGAVDIKNPQPLTRSLSAGAHPPTQTPPPNSAFFAQSHTGPHRESKMFDKVTGPFRRTVFWFIEIGGFERNGADPQDPHLYYRCSDGNLRPTPPGPKNFWPHGLSCLSLSLICVRRCKQREKTKEPQPGTEMWHALFVLENMTKSIGESQAHDQARLCGHISNANKPKEERAMEDQRKKMSAPRLPLTPLFITIQDIIRNPNNDVPFETLKTLLKSRETPRVLLGLSALSYAVIHANEKVFHELLKDCIKRGAHTEMQQARFVAKIIGKLSMAETIKGAVTAVLLSKGLPDSFDEFPELPPPGVLHPTPASQGEVIPPLPAAAAAIPSSLAKK